MHDDEDIAKYFLRVDEVVNKIRGIDEDLKEIIIVQKVLRSLIERFNLKVSTIEQMKNLKSLTLDELLGTLISYETRISNGKSTIKESILKANKKPKEEHNDSCCESDEEEAKFMKNIKRGSGKYKDKLPFKCFNCGKVGSFTSKCIEKKRK